MAELFKVDARDRVATAVVLGAGTLQAGSFGFDGVARTAAQPVGDYTYVLSGDGVDPKDTLVHVTAFGANPPANGMGGVFLTLITNASFRIRLFNGVGALADVNHQVHVFRFVRP